MQGNEGLPIPADKVLQLREPLSARAVEERAASSFSGSDLDLFGALQ
jgi:hypothetical protein